MRVPKAAKYIDASAAAPAAARGGPAADAAPEAADDDFDEPASGGARRPDPAGDLAPRLLTVAAAQDGWRLDRALAALLPRLSRSRLQQWIADGAVAVDPPRAQPLRPRDAVYAGERVTVTPRADPAAGAFGPEPMPLAIVHEDAELLVLDKPPGLVVHPAAGHWSGTLLNGLLAHDPALAALPRAGIVHRLDADTSGLMVVARSLTAQTDLVRQLQARSVTREYWALVAGEPPPEGRIEASIGRDPRNPLRFAVRRGPAAREACTLFRRVQTVEVDGRRFSWVACRLLTGRTHQIRVHLESIGHPLLGDPLYRRGRPTAGGDSPPPWAAFSRQALHACRLGLRHPAGGAPMQWFRAPPADLRTLMKSLGFGRCDRPVKVFA